MMTNWKWYTLLLTTVDWIIVFVGVAGNVLILIALIKYKSVRNPVTKLLFINLTVADLGVLLIRHTFHSIQLYDNGRWVFGEFACKVVPPISRAFLTVSILTLVAISYNRYCCIVGVLKTLPTMQRTIHQIASFWLGIIFLYGCLDVPFRKLDRATKMCQDILSPLKYKVFVIVEKAVYVLCFGSVLYMFFRIKKDLRRTLCFHESSNSVQPLLSSLQTLKILRPTVLVLLVTLCPAWILHFLALLIREVFPQKREECFVLYQAVGILMVFNSAANPFIYVIISYSFKNSFRQILRDFSALFRMKPVYADEAESCKNC